MRNRDAPFNEEEILLYNVVAICMRHIARDTSAIVASTVEWGLKPWIFYFSHAWLGRDDSLQSAYFRSILCQAQVFCKTDFAFPSGKI